MGLVRHIGNHIMGLQFEPDGFNDGVGGRAWHHNGESAHGA